jgi:hypothetical protein
VKMTAKEVSSMILWRARGTATAMGLAVMRAVVLGVGPPCSRRSPETHLSWVGSTL